MHSKKEINHLISFIYLTIVSTIYFFLYFFLEYNLLIKNNWITYLSLILILFCLLTSLINYIFVLIIKANHVYKHDALFTTIAFIFTLISDYYLSYYGDNYEMGLITFILVQITYFIRIEVYVHNKAQFIIKKILFRITIIIILLCVAYFINMFEPLYIKTAIYFSLLCTNFLEALHLSIIALIKSKKDFIYKFLLALGFLLFIGCDICVGISNLTGKASNLIWIFYSPSQLLLNISSFYIIKRGASYEKSN